MNIQNLKWPAFAAASLHGALFFGFPGTPVHTQATTTVREIPFPLPPIDQITETDPPASPPDTQDNPASSGPAVPDIAEPPPPPSIDPVAITTPVYQCPTIGPPVNTLPNFAPGNGPGGPGDITFVQNLDHVPRATVQPSPHYPDNMQKDGITGSVTVEFDVDSSGRVIRAEAIRYTNISFVEPAVRAVLRWHFEPGRRQGHAVPFRMAVPVEFNRLSD